MNGKGLNTEHVLNIDERPSVFDSFNSKDVLFSVLSIFFAFFTLKMTFSKAGGVWVSVLTVIFCLSIYTYAKAKKITISKNSYMYLVYNLLLGLSFSIFENKTFLGVNLIFLVLSCCYWVITLGDARVTKSLDSHVIYDLMKGIFERPFENIRETFAANPLVRVNKKNKNLMYVMIGLLVSLPVLVVVISLLSSADDLFATWVVKFINGAIENFAENSLLFLFSLPLGYFLFLYVYRNMVTPKVSKESIAISKGPNIVFITILTVFILTYLIFFATTIIGFIEFQKEKMTPNTISSYARTGFFQLVKVSMINVVIFIAVKLFGDEEHKIIKTLLSIIGLETLGLIFIGFSKMQLYVSKFGLTLMRFNTSIFMVVLFLCVCFFIAGLWIDYNYTKFSILVMAMSVLGISFFNTGQYIANYNYKKYQAGELKNIDVSMFNSLGADAIPVAMEIYDTTTDYMVRDDLEEYFNNMKTDIEDTSKNTINYSRINGMNLIEDFKEAQQHDS